jgi:amino acid permease
MYLRIILFVLVSNITIAQEYPTLITQRKDTIVGISPHQYNMVLFSFSYIKSLRKNHKISTSKIINLESQIAIRDSIIDAQSAQIDQYVLNEVDLQKVIDDYKKDRRKSKTKNTIIYIAGGGVIIGEAVLIGYALFR